MTTLALGCRDPQSTAGTWNGACVICETRNEGVISAIFADGKDYISNCDLTTALTVYEHQLGAGWVPMTADDISLTAGVTIDRGTITDIEGFRATIRNRKILYGFIGLTGLVVGTAALVRYYLI